MSELELNDPRRELETVPCISLHQPWASWIAWGWKPIETRTHNKFAGLVGKRIAIHATKRFDENAIIVAQKYLTIQQAHAADYDYLRGAILCTAFVAGSRRLTLADSAAALIDCGSTLRFGLILQDVRQLSRPVPIPGQLSIWQIRRELIAEAL